LIGSRKRQQQPSGSVYAKHHKTSQSTGQMWATSPMARQEQVGQRDESPETFGPDLHVQAQRCQSPPTWRRYATLSTALQQTTLEDMRGAVARVLITECDLSARRSPQGLCFCCRGTKPLAVCQPASQLGAMTPVGFLSQQAPRGSAMKLDFVTIVPMRLSVMFWQRWWCSAELPSTTSDSKLQ
jgi:hypothetical protein